MTADEARKLTAANRKKLLPEPLLAKIKAVAEAGHDSLTLPTTELQGSAATLRSLGYRVVYEDNDGDDIYEAVCIAWDD